MADPIPEAVSIHDETLLVDATVHEAAAHEAPLDEETPSAVPIISANEAPAPSGKVPHVFNQYYFDLLKRLKTWAKDNKERSKVARDVLRAIKKNYASYDRLSSEHRDWFTQTTEAVRVSYAAVPTDGLTGWQPDAGQETTCVFHDIPLSALVTVFKDEPYTLHQYLTTLFALSYPMTDEQVSLLLQCLRNQGQGMEQISPSEVQHLWSRFISSKESLLRQFPSTFKDMEDTSLGRLAKEIMEEVDIGKLQSTLGEGDIFKALADPNSGMANLLSTVSQKMINKMASGEIRQENLLSDALQFASKLGGGMGMGAGGRGPGGMDLSGFGNMLKNMQGMLGGEDGGDGPDLSAMTSMLGNMLGGGSSGGKRAAASAMSQQFRRSSKATQLRKKLDARKARGNGNGNGDGDTGAA